MSHESILIADDEPGIRLMLRTALESDGFQINEAADGEETLDSIAREKPDLLVLDLNMPRTDGMAVLEQIKSMPTARRPRVIILTAFGSIPAAVKATRLGALDFLEKPITPAELRLAVRGVIDEPLWDSPPVIAHGEDRYEHALRRARNSLRIADWESAENLLMKAADRNAKHSAEYFNLLGVLYEAQQKWRLARKCYGKAMRASGKYAAAETNMRRLYELYAFGRSKQPVLLGDEINQPDEAHELIK